MESEKIKCELKDDGKLQIINNWDKFLEECGLKDDKKQEQKSQNS